MSGIEKCIMGIILIVALCLIGSCSAEIFMGVGIFGPTRNQTVKVVSKHVDTTSNHGSHYMVTTDKGTYEVDNGFILGVWNADELYGRLNENMTYDIRARGNRVVNMFIQGYPYITDVKLVNTNVSNIVTNQ